MGGKFKIIGALIFALLCNCKKQMSIENSARELISQNINVLIDSVESFDMSKIQRPKKFRNIKVEKITVGLLDSILIEKSDLNAFVKKSKTNFLQFNIKEDDLINFKANYKINIVKINNYDINVLFIRLSNLTVSEDEASIIVTKVRGISMIKNRYFFKKKKEEWVFIRKEMVSMG
jgi:hypothetical protein